MKIIIAADIAIEFDADFLTSAFSSFPTIETFVILRELVGGKSTASVFVVDIVTKRQAAGKTSKTDAPSGQFVLKTDHDSKHWPFEPSEAQRHIQASDSGFAFMQLDVEREYPAFVRARWVSAST